MKVFCDISYGFCFKYKRLRFWRYFVLFDIGEISFQSGQQSNHFYLLKGLMRVFAISVYGFQDTLFQARKTEILEVWLRCFSNFFNNQNNYSKKLSSVPRQYLWDEHTRKTGLTDAHNFKNLAAKIWSVYLLYLRVRVRYDRTNSCSADLLHRLLKDTALLVIATPA